MTEAPLVASLAMYPFEQLRGSADALWGVIHQHLGWGPSVLEWKVPAPDVWRHPNLLLAQTCGWPLVNQLAGEVAVVGTFDYDVPNAAGGRYQSVLVTSHPATLEELRARPGAVAAINTTDSLSGWVSLRYVWGSVPPTAVLETGSHLESVRAIDDGRADVASIDAVSWALIVALYPQLVSRLRLVGAGPLVPCLPLVVPLRHGDQVDELRAAFTAAVADRTAAEACAALRIRSFVPLDLADYLPLRSLLGST